MYLLLLIGRVARYLTEYAKCENIGALHGSPQRPAWDRRGGRDHGSVVRET